MKKILISCFEPFAGIPINPSQQLVEKLDQKKIGNHTIQSVVLPVSFEKSFQKLELAITEINPDIVISFGLGIGRQKIEVERIAVNCKSSNIPDNDGEQPTEEKIDPQDSDGIFTRLPILDLFKYASLEKMPLQISESAGTYVCNYVFYRLLQEAKKKKIGAGFIHIPPTPEVFNKMEVNAKESKTHSLEFSILEEATIKILLWLSATNCIDYKRI